MTCSVTSNSLQCSGFNCVLHSGVIVQRLLVCQIYIASGGHASNFQVHFIFPVLDCLCQNVAVYCAPMDTHDIATKPSAQVMVLRHGPLPAFDPLSSQ